MPGRKEGRVLLMDVCARKKRRKERNILVNYLIQIQISVGMLEIQISVPRQKEGRRQS